MSDNEQNLTYKIKEKNDNNDNNPLNIEELMANFEKENVLSDFSPKSSYNSMDINHDDYLTMEINYNTNYTVKDLTNIMDYYNTIIKTKIKKSKLTKDEMIQIIILFETDPENQLFVYKRKQLWHYVKELKSDDYFKKFVLFNVPNDN